MRMFLLLTMVMVACDGDDGEPIAPAQTPCEQLREHLIDLRLADASPKVDKDAHRIAMRGAFGDSFLSSCSRMSEENRTCALSATTLADAMGCETKEAR